MPVSALTIRSPAMDVKAFKSAMRHLAAGVSVVTSQRGSHINGMTATAVCSVSTDPPSVLVVVNRSSSSHALISDSGTFAVNFLHERQADLARYFSGNVEKCFDGIPHHFGETGCPLLEACCASMECEIASTCDFGTHSIFVGKVLAVRESAEVPLVYFDARFHGLGVELAR